MTRAADLAKTAEVLDTSTFTFRNRVINGAMEVDQRYFGSAVTINNGSLAYPVDRFYFENNSGSAVISVQQVSDAPVGFTKSAKVTVTTADSTLNATDRTLFYQGIEGYNVSDLDWSTSLAKTVTLSFWVKSSLTGSFGGVVINVASTVRYYPFSYTISAANTWEYKTIIVPGDTLAGTMTKDNTAGVKLLWGLGVGSTYSGTVNTWSSTLYLSSTGAVNFTATLNATWQITGVQFEVGSVATPFEKRHFGLELLLCQRYYQRSDGFTRGGSRLLEDSAWNSRSGAMSRAKRANYYDFYETFRVEMRATPSMSLFGSSGVNNVRMEVPGVSNKEVALNATSFNIGQTSFFLRHTENTNDGEFYTGSGNAFARFNWEAGSEI